MAPSHAGVTPSPAHAEGGARHGVPPRRVLPSVERQAAEPASAVPPALLSAGRPTRRRPEASPAVDAYSLRLVATRKLYDLGTDVQHAPGLAGLASDTTLRLHPHDFDRLGVDAGAVVTVTASTGSLTLPVVARSGRRPRARPPSCCTSPARRWARSSTPPPAVTEVRVVKA